MRPLRNRAPSPFEPHSWRCNARPITHGAQCPRGLSLPVLQAVTRAGSFSQAAKHTGVTPRHSGKSHLCHRALAAGSRLTLPRRTAVPPVGQGPARRGQCRAPASCPSTTMCCRINAPALGTARVGVGIPAVETPTSSSLHEQQARRGERGPARALGTGSPHRRAREVWGPGG